jgi:hypothetical protein
MLTPMKRAGGLPANLKLRMGDEGEARRSRRLTFAEDGICNSLFAAVTHGNF